MAIAFYDSNRLLPYRHDLKQKQIEQRNQDAERTRQYIGYAGGAFANMAERTGTIFGGRLGSAPAVDAKGEAIAKYGGGTVGAQASQAEWQKGITDEDNKRRQVTHKLGLFMKNVEYGNLQQQGKAWGWRDRDKLETGWNKMFDMYIKDSNQMSKYDLIVKYKHLFPKATQTLLGDYAAAKTDDDREKIMKELTTQPQHTATSNFMTWATDMEYYNPKIAAAPREDVNMLVNYVRNELKFPGMSNPMEEQKEKDQPGSLHEEEWQKQLSPTEVISQDDQQTDDKSDTSITPVALVNPSDTNQAAGQSSSPKILTEDTAKIKEQAIRNSRNGGVLSIQLAEQTEDGRELSIWEVLADAGRKFQEQVAVSVETGSSLFGAGQAGDRAGEWDKAKQTILNRVMASWVRGEDMPDDIKQGVSNAVDNMIVEAKSKAEVHERKWKPSIARTVNPVIKTIEEATGLDEGLRIDETVPPIKKDLSAVHPNNSAQFNKQVVDNLLYIEDPKMTGEVIDDKSYAILGGSVNAWQMAQGTSEHKGKVMTQVREALGLKPESSKWKALEKYFMAGDVNEYLGHVVTGADGIEGSINPTQQANRDSVKLSRDQIRALSKWAYDKNLKTLTANHGFLTKRIYDKYPQLKQLLGDMAYRHGGSFMTRENLGYTGLRDAIDAALDPRNSKNEARGALSTMMSELFSQGVYAREFNTRRLHFLQDRFNKFYATVMSQAKYSPKPKSFVGKGREGSRGTFKIRKK